MHIRHKLQEYLAARASSTAQVKRKFGISPSDNGYIFYMRDGTFLYNEEQIKEMLSEFEGAVNQFSGTRFVLRPT